MSKAIAARSVSPVVGFLAALALVAAALLAGLLTTAGHDVAGSVWNKKPPASAGSVWNKTPRTEAGSVWNSAVHADGSVWN